MSTSVIVLGSGVAGLTAALAAAHHGARVTLLEATSTVGGTTALSGGVAWVPLNHRGAELGVDDDRDAVLTYLDELARGDTDRVLLERFVDAGAGALRRTEERSPLRWRAIAYPDYHVGRSGSRAAGRGVEPDPITVPRELEPLVRSPVSWRVRATQDEIIRGTFSRELGDQRERDGVQTMGRALVAGLLIGALDAGVEVRPSVRVEKLRLDAGRVVGVETAHGPLSGAVVLATGGFERDPALLRAFLRAPVEGLTGAPGARGDGLRMAMRLGASLGNMSEAWWAPTVQVPGAEIEGQPLAHLLLSERGRPGTLMVDQRGRRFCNEAQNYNDVGRALHAFDPGGYRFERDPSWLVVDAAFRARYPLGPVMRGEPDPEGWHRAEGPAELAREIGVPEDAFVDELARYNAAAGEGRDPDFGRGSSEYDRFVGDPRSAHPNLRPLEGELTAVPVRAGTLGTKGGPRTDADGRVRHVDGGAIPGLYAAGNAAASPFGMLYAGAGGTIGPALVFGDLAGTAAASDRR